VVHVVVLAAAEAEMTRADMGKPPEIADQRSRPRGATWIDRVLVIAMVLATLVVAWFFLNNDLGGDLGGPARSVSNAPGP
jgi:hypothetical protein